MGKEIKVMKGLNIGGTKIPSHCSALWDFLQYSKNSYKETRMTIDYDLLSCERIPKEDNYYDLIYSSHTLEHLPNKAIEYTLQESYRLLKPGGIIRITCPDGYLLLDMYLNKTYIPWRYGKHFTNFDAFFYNIFQPISKMEPNIVGNKIDEKDFLELLNTHGREKTFEILSELVVKTMTENNVKFPSAYHVSALYPKKMESYLKNAGFKKIKQTTQREGYSSMVNTPLNETCSWGSLYMVGCKE